MADTESISVEWWDFGPLNGVTEVRWESMLVAVVLRFGEHAVEFSAMSDDDTLVVREVDAVRHVQREREHRNATDDAPWSRFVGSGVSWGRTMTNHHGYVDGYQLEFESESHAVGDGIEMVVVASSIKVGTSHFDF